MAISYVLIYKGLISLVKAQMGLNTNILKSTQINLTELIFAQILANYDKMMLHLAIHLYQTTFK